MKKSAVSISSVIVFFAIFSVIQFSFKGFENNSKKQWYKGNTHTHTTVSDGNADPDYVVNWYHERGYNFLVLTDHNKFVNPDSVNLPVNLRNDFILIPGEEVTGKRHIHTTGLNVNGFVHPGDEFSSKTEVIQSHVDSVIFATGVPILNHPNFLTGAQVDDIYPVKRLHMIELFNGHPSVFNWGREGNHIQVEAKWDSLLSRGQKYFAISSDDAHHYDEFYPEKSNPGRGWIMVRSSKLSPDSIVEAIRRGDFYATNGLILKNIQADKKSYEVEIDMDATREELKSPYLTGNIVESGTRGFSIAFIGNSGKVLKEVEGTSANYNISGNEHYVRCRVTYCRKRSENKFEKIYAWTQPVFLWE